MSLVGFKAANHPQQVRRAGAREDIDDRATTLEDFAAIADRHGPFTVDVAAAAHNTKCKRYYDRGADGLSQDWSGERVWCNPPYSTITPWVAKAWASWATTLGITMLLPANRAEQQWWQQMVEPFRDRPRSPLAVEFLPGRMRFLRRGQSVIGPNERPPFGCVLLVWTPPLTYQTAPAAQDTLPFEAGTGC